MVLLHSSCSDTFKQWQNRLGEVKWGQEGSNFHYPNNLVHFLIEFNRILDNINYLQQIHTVSNLTEYLKS